MRYMKAFFGALFATTLATLSLLPTTLFAAGIYTVPPGLSPGSGYRLAFVTDGITTATSGDISTYNTFVNNQAGLSTPLASLGTTWTAIASTVSTDVASNTDTNPLSAIQYPIFTLDGALVASSYFQLWNNDLNYPLIIDQFGAAAAGSIVWTGIGSGDPTLTGDLGSQVARTVGEDVVTQTPLWFDYVTAGQLPSNVYRLYAISAPLTVPAAVPEPPTLGLLAFGLLGLIVVGLRRRTA